MWASLSFSIGAPEASSWVFDLMQMEYLVGRDVRVLKADLGGLRANYLLMSQRTPNPFDMSTLRTFRMPVQL